MNHLCDISDDEFIPFLDSLGIETYKKSFEWMLHDPDFAHVLKWLYKNVDQNNVLTAREEYRYIELKKTNSLLTPDKLETSILSLQHEFEGLCLPGDQESMEDMKLDISMQKERLSMLEKHEEIVNDLIKQNSFIKENLDIELTKLNASEQQCIEDESALGEQCITLAEEVESIIDNVCDIIVDNLKSCSNSDKEFSSKFFAFGPFESYRQSQALFKSHFDLYITKRFDDKQMEKVSNEDLQTVLSEAKALEERLSDAVCSYITTKAELCGEQAQIRLVLDYDNVLPSQIFPCSLEAQNSVDILHQEENILDQQLQDAVKNFVSMQTNFTVETAARTALNIRERVDKNLSYLLEATREALSLDKFLYYVLRNELRSLEELLHFASHLRQYVITESDAVRGRIESMNEICTEQSLAEQHLQSNNLLSTLYMLLGAEPSEDAIPLVRLHSQLRGSIKKLTEDMAEGFKKKEVSLLNLKQSRQPLEEYIWDGCTKQPNCYDRSAASMWHELRSEIDRVDRKVQEASGQFTSVKNGDKRGLRKIWQWFLTDPAKLLSVIKSVQSKGYM